METQWYVVPTKEALALGIPDVSKAGDAPYLLIDIGGRVIVFDFHAMLAMVEGFNTAIEQQMKVIAEQKAELLEQQDGAD